MLAEVPRIDCQGIPTLNCSFERVIITEGQYPIAQSLTET
jgi:hypothetical protein